MDTTRTQALCQALGYDEEPFGFHYTDTPPPDALMAVPCVLPSRQDEMEQRADWGAINKNFSCVLKYVWRARVQGGAAAVSREQFGCLGGAFFLGFNKPQLEGVVHYVSTGIPGFMEGERYIDSPARCREFFETVDPLPATATHAVFKPLSQFGDDETPLVVQFFARPEVMSGLHQLAMFITGDPHAVASPFGAGCTNLVSWPLQFLAQGTPRAVLGGWDPSARPWFKPDELSFTVPLAMFQTMLERWEQSFLTTHAWKTVVKKIDKSRRAWGQGVRPGQE
ncbi:hypothetical protein DGI_1412 [Megalodesulfovibrio gigas DSM 1382 = ATCC 19364]|uniref:DUF169 domain-containing protein n=2 Tax=Megalodesulfovibrio gigas TaxID=879 RepID=T2GAE0_MEGG1|nr:hypothetical protein DGI_1412 [Megalodesulfovibrio gigas DSM 1382 = ATCC 19364]